MQMDLGRKASGSDLIACFQIPVKGRLKGSVVSDVNGHVGNCPDRLAQRRTDKFGLDRRLQCLRNNKHLALSELLPAFSTEATVTTKVRLFAKNLAFAL